jgi:hypothetical protein
MRDGIARLWSCALMLFLCSCGNLSHSSATSLIEQVPEFNSPREASLDTGSVILSLLDPIYPALQSMGLITVTDVHSDMPVAFPIAKATVEVTAADADRQEWRQVRVETCCVRWSVPLAKRSIIAIIGIREINSDTREVEFQWKWRLTRLGGAVVNQRPEIEKRHSALLDQLSKQRQAKEEYERSHRVLLPGQDQNLSFALNAISEDYQRHFVQNLVDDSKDYRSVATVYRLDTGWQLGQQGLRNLLESLKKSEQ